MNETSISQLYSFLIFIGIGILIVLIFDIFRIFRKSFKTPDFVTYIEDVIFWIIIAIILLYSILKFNSGQLRLYIFLGIILGGVIYILTISKSFIKISVLIIKMMKRIFKNIFNMILFPLKFILKVTRKIFLKPISFFFFNFKKKFTNFGEKNSQIIRKNKLKKGF